MRLNVSSQLSPKAYTKARPPSWPRHHYGTIALVRALRLFLVGLLSLSSAFAQADRILHNGKVISVDRNGSIHQAVAIKDGRISAVGESAAILEAHRGPDTEIVDLEGRSVLPGLVDSHVHALGAGLSEFREKLPPLDSIPAVQRYIRRQAKQTPKGDWIVVPRTFPTRLAEMRMPTRYDLDVVKNHPVMFDASYTVVVNSFALEMSKIGRSTAHPPDGEIVIDENGEPNGILKNAQSMLKGLDREKGFTREEKLEALAAMLQRYRAAGLTAVSDRAVTDESIELYRELQSTGRLPVRVVMTWRPGIPDDFDEVLDAIRKREGTTGSGDRWLKFGPYKVTSDGGMTIGTAYQRYPYGPFGKQLYGMTNPDNIGILSVKPEKLLGIFREASAKGWQLTSHVQGGGAIDSFLKVMQELDGERPIKRARHHLMHASFQSQEAIELAASLGVGADVQSPWLYYDGPALKKVFGDDGLKLFFPLRSYIDAGIHPAGGSDHMVGHDKNGAVNPYNPFLQMWISITRKTSTGDVLRPEQRISRDEALKMHTIWAAEMQFAEDERGSIEVGKLADLVVLDRDYLTCPEDEIKDIEPWKTIVEGLDN
jgi:predicted amidohydrolase YtcJ